MHLVIRLFIFFYACISIAQTDVINVKKSEVFKDKKMFDNFLFVIDDGNGGVIAGKSANNSTLIIQNYTKELNLKQSPQSEFETKKIPTAFLNNNSLNTLEYRFNPDSDDLECYAIKTPLNNLSFQKELLFTISKGETGKRGMPWGQNRGTSDFDNKGTAIVSKNQKYIVFSIDLENKESETHRLYLYNNELKRIFQTDFERDIKDNLYEIADVKINEENGDIYLLGKAFSEEKEDKEVGANYQYELYRINDKTEKLFTFQPKEKFVDELKIFVSNNNVNCLGFYTEGEERNLYKGTVFISPNQPRGIFSSFSNDFLTEKYGENLNKDLYDIKIKDIFITEDQGFIIIGEDSSIYNYPYKDPVSGKKYYDVTYYHYDILYTKLDKSGNIINAQDINKKQSSKENHPYNSVVSTYKDGITNMYITGKDDIKTLDNNRIEFKEASSSNACLYKISIDENEKFSYKKLFDFKDSDLSFNEFQIFNISSGIVFFNQKSNKKQYFKILD